MLSGLENPVHILLLLVVLLLLFGARRLPELGRSLGTGLREFKTSLTAGPAVGSGEDEDGHR
jgi:sec-independent protein translocase protein TatA